MADHRVPVAPLLAAFGVAATVTRPAPDTTPIATTGIWLDEALEEERPYGTDFQRRDPRRLMAIPRADVSTLPRGTLIAAPELAGKVIRTWRVDGLAHVDPEWWQGVVTREVVLAVTAMVERGSFVELGGDSRSYLTPSGSDVYPAGATFDKLVPGSSPFAVDAAGLVGTFVLEATAKVKSVGGARAKVALFSLDGGTPDTPLVGSEITFTADHTTGERKRSGTIVWPSGGSAKQIGAKVTVNSTTIQASAYGIRVIRTA